MWFPLLIVLIEWISVVKIDFSLPLLIPVLLPIGMLLPKREVATTFLHVDGIHSMYFEFHRHIPRNSTSAISNWATHKHIVAVRSLCTTNKMDKWVSWSSWCTPQFLFSFHVHFFPFRSLCLLRSSSSVHASNTWYVILLRADTEMGEISLDVSYCMSMLMCGRLYWDDPLLLQLMSEKKSERGNVCSLRTYGSHMLLLYVAATNNMSYCRSPISVREMKRMRIVHNFQE